MGAQEKLKAWRKSAEHLRRHQEGHVHATTHTHTRIASSSVEQTHQPSQQEIIDKESTPEYEAMLKQRILDANKGNPLLFVNPLRNNFGKPRLSVLRPGVTASTDGVKHIGELSLDESKQIVYQLDQEAGKFDIPTVAMARKDAITAARRDKALLA